MQKKKILVIDDESPIAEMIADFCESFGFETRVLDRGDIAVEVAKGYKPDLVTVDLVMPETSGFEVVEMLKSDPATQNIPIIVISSYSWAKEAARTFNLTEAVVTKPVTMKVLGDQIELALSSR